MTDNNSVSVRSGGSSLINFVGLGAGAYHGFCDSQGIKFEKENLEAILTYGPAALGGVIGIVGGAISGGIVGGVLGIAANDSYKISSKISTGALGSVAGALGIGAIGGTIGAAAGGIMTLIGYGAGYTTGYLLR